VHISQEEEEGKSSTVFTSIHWDSIHTDLRDLVPMMSVPVSIRSRNSQFLFQNHLE